MTPDFQQALPALLGKFRADDLYVGANVPPEKLHNAVAHFPIPRSEIVLGLIDCTVFGSCKVGLAITQHGLIWKNDWTTQSTQTRLSWQELVDCSATMHAASMGVTFAAGIIFNMAGSSAKPAQLIQLCHALVDLLESGVERTGQSSAPTSNNALPASDSIAVALMAKFAKAGGAVTQRQIATLEEIFDGMSDAQPGEIKRYIAIFNRAKSDDQPFHALAEQLSCADEDDDFFTGIYEALWVIAVADGAPRPAHLALLRQLPDLLDLDAGLYGKLARQYMGVKHDRPGAHDQTDTSMRDYFQLLGCAPDASDAELKTAYRRKMSSLHPDKLQSKELADELMQFATQQVQRINHAYEQILKQRNA